RRWLLCMRSEIELSRIKLLRQSKLSCAIESLNLSIFVSWTRKIGPSLEMWANGAQSRNSSEFALRKAVLENKAAQNRSHIQLLRARKAVLLPESLLTA